jgi:hypothetical protein
MFPNGARGRVDGCIDGRWPAAYGPGKSIVVCTGQPVSLVVGFRGDQTLDKVCEALSFRHPENVIDDNKLRVALDLYVSFVPENSPKARFLTLALSLEALLPKEAKPAYAVEMIDRWLAEVKKKRDNVAEKMQAAVEANEQGAVHAAAEEAKVYDSLKGGLEFQRSASISSMVRKLVCDTLARRGRKDAAEMAARAVKLYSDRSTLVRTGYLPPEQLSASTAELQSILQQVLAARFTDVSA